MRITTFLAALATAWTVFAAEATPRARKPLTPEQMQAMRERRERVRREYEEKTGGVVKVREPGPVITLVDAQKNVPHEAFAAAHRQLEQVLALPIDLISETVKNPMNDAPNFVNFKSAACVVCVADPTLPPMLVAPEAHWAILNVAALAKDKPSAKTLAERVQKETWRTFFHLLGAANSQTRGCLMQTISDPKELDGILADRVCPEPYGKVLNGAYKLGVSRMKIANYRRACEEGWAPPPSTDVQRRIAAEVEAAKKQGKTDGAGK